MKTKNKLIALVEIAVVLCSLFLVAIPAVVAEQNQELQKASMSAITTASEDDYVLEIYGNANEDDTIDMGDVVYIKLAIFGKKPKTELCDAKYDGRINVLDVIQTKLIILGKEKELTVVDAEGAAKTVSMPVEEIVVLNAVSAEAIRAVGAKDRISGIEGATAKRTKFFPKISRLPSVGSGNKPDLEKILEMKPDIVIAYAPGVYNPGHEGLEDKLEPTITVVRLDFYKIETVREEMLRLGYLLNAQDNARKWLEWCDSYVNAIENKISEIPEKDKPDVFLDWCAAGTVNRHTQAKGAGFHMLCEKAGGNNIAADLSVRYPTVELEWIIRKNPDIIVGYAHGRRFKGGSGYEVDDISYLRAYHNEITELPGFEHLLAVENNRVYIMSSSLVGSPGYLVGFSYMAKWFYPKLFEDLNPQALHQEYIDEFCGIEFNVKEHGVFVYHPPTS